MGIRRMRKIENEIGKACIKSLTNFSFELFFILRFVQLKSSFHKTWQSIHVQELHGKLNLGDCNNNFFSPVY